MYNYFTLVKAFVIHCLVIQSKHKGPGIILCMGEANGRRRYIVTSSLIGWADTQSNYMGQNNVDTSIITHFERSTLSELTIF